MALNRSVNAQDREMAVLEIIVFYPLKLKNLKLQCLNFCHRCCLNESFLGRKLSTIGYTSHSLLAYSIFRFLSLMRHFCMNY